MRDDDARLFQMDGTRWEAVWPQLMEKAAPFYLFHAAGIVENIQALRRRLGGAARITYAVKANPWLAQAAAGEADFLEVCSPGDLALCRSCGIPGRQLMADGVFQSDGFLQAALDMGCTRFGVDSFEQMERLLCAAGSTPLNVLLRVTSGNQFGMEQEELQACLHIGEGRAVRIAGLQYFPGTQRMDFRRVRRELDQLDDWIRIWEDLFGAMPEEIEFGAGIGVPYFEGENPEDYAKLLDTVRDWIQPLEARCRIVYEAGRLLVASCGIYVTEIFAKKRRNDRTCLFCKGGTNHLCYPGGILGVRTPIHRGLSARPAGAPGRYAVFGPLCSESDVLIRDGQGRESGLTEGDRIIFFGAGAYSATEAPNLFLGLARPSIIVYNQSNNDPYTFGRSLMEIYGSDDQRDESSEEDGHG